MYEVLHQLNLDWGINILSCLLIMFDDKNAYSFLETKVKFLKSYNNLSTMLILSLINKSNFCSDLGGEYMKSELIDFFQSEALLGNTLFHTHLTKWDCRKKI